MKRLIADAKEIRFNDPEESSGRNFHEVINTFKGNRYFDFIITTDKLNINERMINDVFINLGRDNEDVELLFYFDCKDLNLISLKEAIKFLKIWATEFKKEYDFEYFICQIDNAEKDEYYFDSNGFGRLYDQVNFKGDN